MKRILSALVLALIALPLLAQNPDFDRRYQQAQTQYNQGQYEKARTTMRTALKNLPSLSADQKQKANNLISQCNSSINNRDRLVLGTDSLKVSFDSSRDSLGIDVANISKISAVSSAPDWCAIDKLANGYVYVTTTPNPDKAPRLATVTVSLGKVKSEKFTVVQAPRPETVKRLVISTLPDRAKVSIDGTSEITGIWEGLLPSGSHKVHIEKSGYAPKDTVITVQDDLIGGEELIYGFKLKPNFGRLSIKVLPEDGFAFDKISPYTVSINGRNINMMRPENYSYNDDRDIMYYEVYDDGSIPVPAGWASIIAAASNFETERKDIQMTAQGHVQTEFILKARTGYLSIVDTGKARGAKVWLDDELIGTVGEIIKRRTVTGDHVVRLEKDNHISGEQSYAFAIKENEEFFLNVSMSRFATYFFDSDPADARVYVNDEYIGNTPTSVPYYMRENDSGSRYVVTVTKDHYMPYEKTYSPNFDTETERHESFQLTRTAKLRVEADEAGLQLTVKNRRHGDSTYVSLAMLPTDLELPVRKKPYYVELHRVGQSSAAYRGSMSFKSPDKTRHYIQSWSKSSFQFLSVNGLVWGMGGIDNIPIGAAGPEGNAKIFRNLGTVGLAKFSVFGIPGLSTSLIKAAAFLGKDTEEKLYMLPGQEAQTFGVLPAFSVLLINGEFRMGGALFCDYADISLMASYAWYPDVFKTFVGFSHITGHDVFAGLEISSRLPIGNVNIKAGMQMYPDLKANLSLPDAYSGKSIKYETYPMEIPTMFVISAGLSLGPKSNKGENILRIF